MRFHWIVVCACCLCLVHMQASAQPAFDSGSDGTDGVLFIGAASGTVTLNVPEPDGIFNFTTITIQSGGTLAFNPNSLNTPAYLLATGDVAIHGNINVN